MLINRELDVAMKISNIVLVIGIWYSCAIRTDSINSSVTYFYGFKCYFGHQQLTDNSRVFVRYDGAPILCDEISFLAAQGDRYQLCFTPVYYHDPYCQIFIEYLSYETGDILQILECQDNHTITWCSGETSTVNVRIKMTSSVRQWTMARVKIKLEAKPRTTANVSGLYKEYGIPSWCFVIFGVGGLVFLLVVIMIVVVKHTGARRWVNKTFNAGEAATSNSDLPPTYQEATNSRPTCSLYIREPLPPKYSDIFSDTQRS